MRIVFMGTPDFAACSLRGLLAASREIVGVFCQPDKPKNRGHRLQPCPVKEAALAAGLPVFQPGTLRDGQALEILRSLRPDLMAVVAYGRILPAELLDLPPLGCVNVHGSLLPKYRGSAPVQRAVLNGETVTGVTTMYLSPGMDEGDIIFSRETPIGPEETSGALMDRLAPLGAQLLVETLRAIEAGTAPRTPQDPDRATYAPPLTKEEAPVDWTRGADEILCHIRGMQPWPCATAVLGGTEFRLFAARGSGRKISNTPGSVVSAGKTGIEVACGGETSVIITELQAAGGRRMTASAYLAGHRLEAD